ncbi:exported hypothetical protein [uncultured delta proteobacterium]|uniref:Uncharacterized protein n=1 Tax=uncultured delta proteobacterium TaxID=34034 RepID=A0A212KB60_9DELT|nr:exported hypothetical protein [uncultured delta proteobacterium]
MFLLHAGRRLLFAVLAALVCLPGGASPALAANSSVEQLVAVTGALPSGGRVVIRSGLAWLVEDDPLFSVVARSLAEALIEHGLAVVETAPSLEAPLPKGAESIRSAPVPKHRGRPRRIMSVAEAVARMKAMQLAREGRLPQAAFNGAKKGNGTQLPSLTHQELIRFALSQEDGGPELGGHVSVPGRLPAEVTASDPGIADYAVTVRFSMLWPGSGIPDEPQTMNSNSGLAVGWHLLELACYDLAPVRQGKQPSRVWSAVVQRVAFGMYLRGTLPRMARDAVQDL